MGERRRIHADDFKAKVALEAFKGVRTLSELWTNTTAVATAAGSDPNSMKITSNCNDDKG